MRAVPTVGSAARPVAMLAVVLSLGACVSSPDPSAVASIDECRIETRRELQHVGPPGKSPPRRSHDRFGSVSRPRPAPTGSS